MANDDDIERLLREVEALESGGAAKALPPASASGRDVAKAPDDAAGSSRKAWVALAAASGGVAGFVLGSMLFFLPWVNGPSTAIGAALGAAIAALIGGPPRWFDK